MLFHLPSYPALLSGPPGVATTPLSTALDIGVPVVSTPLPRASSFLLSFQTGIVPLPLGVKEGAKEDFYTVLVALPLCGCNLGESFRLPGETR